MKKNLLAVLVVFFFTFVVLLVISDISKANNPQVKNQHTTIDK